MNHTYREESTTQKFIKSTIWNHLGKMVQFILGFLLTVLITRKLGVHLYGQYCWIISFCFFCSLFIQLGFENVLNTYIPKLKDRPEHSSFLIRRLITIRLFTVLIGCIAILVLLPWIDRLTSINNLKTFIIYIIGYIFCTNFASILSRIILSQLRIKLLSIINVSMAFLQLVIVYILLNAGYSLEALLLIVVLISLCSCCLYLLAIKDIFQVKRKRFDLKSMFSFARASWLTSLVEFGLGKQIDILLIGYFVANIAETGYYNLGISVPVMLSGMMTAGLGGVTLATLSEIERKRGLEELGLAWKSLIKLQFILSAPILAFLIVYARPLITIIYSESYFPAVAVLQVFCMFYLASKVLGGGTHISALYSMDRAKPVLFIRLGGGLINLVLNIILIPGHGAMGAVVATGFSLMVTVVLEFVYLKTILRQSYPFIFVLKVSLATTVALLVLRVFPVQTIFSLIGISTGYILLLLLILYIIKPLNQEDKMIIKYSNIPELKWLAYLYA